MNEFKEEDRIQVISLRENRSKKYQKLDKLYGIIEVADNLNNNYGVRIDNYNNSESQKGLYWFYESEIAIIPIENRVSIYGNNQMKLISKNNKPKLEENIMSTENKELNQVARCQELLDQWECRHNDIAKKWEIDKKREIKSNDRIHQASKIYGTELKSIIKEEIDGKEIVFENITIPEDDFIAESLRHNNIMTSATRRGIELVSMAFRNYTKTINKTYNEILAFLKATETYEQELDVLINYDVLDECEKLFVDKDIICNDLDLALGELQYATK